MSNETPDAARLDALGYVEQTIYANEDSSPAITWRNDEVVELLREVAERLRVRGDVAELCSYCLTRPSVASTPDGDTICDECSDGPLCDEPYPADPTAGGCWLLKGHDGDHDIYGGTYLWPRTPDHMVGGER